MDIYFRPEYAKLSALIDAGTPEEYIYQTEQGKVLNRFIKREIPITVNDTVYYDIVTPYGYGGPLIVECKEGAKDALVREYETAFADYCRQQRIVSEFVRFHPLYNNAEDFGAVYDTQAIRKTVGTNLADYEDPVQSEFGKSCRKNIRKAINAGVTYRVTQAPKSIEAFTDIYYATMQRDHASEYYFFDKSYFDTMSALLSENLIFIEAIFEGVVIAASLCFVSDGCIHIHLSGTRSEYLYLSPAYVLRYAAVLWGKEHGLRMVHHGGGTSNTPDNPLYCFKKQFGKNTEFDFCIGKRIWEPDVYTQLVEATGLVSDTEFFPAYRRR